MLILVLMIGVKLSTLPTLKKKVFSYKIKLDICEIMKNLNYLKITTSYLILLTDYVKQGLSFWSVIQGEGRVKLALERWKGREGQKEAGAEKKKVKYC